MIHHVKYLLIISIFLYSCSNDFRPEYQKELMYDGCPVAIDTMNLKTYLVLQQNDSTKLGDLYDETTKWYDLNGYHSMTVSSTYLKGAVRTSKEEITRDKYSLPVAKNTLVEAEGTEPLVTLSRLKNRKKGKEEWLFRHYLDPEKHLEDASTLSYSEKKRTIYKVDSTTDTLQVKGIDVFDGAGRLVQQIPVNIKERAPHIKTYYNSETGYVDSIISAVYKQNDSAKVILHREIERYTYEWNEKKVPSRRYTYLNDSLSYITDYHYGYRK